MCNITRFFRCKELWLNPSYVFSQSQSDVILFKKGKFLYSAVCNSQDCSKCFTLYFPDLFNQSTSQLLWEASSHMLQLMRDGCSYTYLPLSIARYSFIQLSELELCRVNKLTQGFNIVAHDSNPGPVSQVSEALPMSHCALQSSSLFHSNFMWWSLVLWNVDLS